MLYCIILDYQSHSSSYSKRDVVVLNNLDFLNGHAALKAKAMSSRIIWIPNIRDLNLKL